MMLNEAKYYPVTRKKIAKQYSEMYNWLLVYLKIKCKNNSVLQTAFSIRKESSSSTVVLVSPQYVRSLKAFLHSDVCNRNNPLVSAEEKFLVEKRTIFEHFCLDVLMKSYREVLYLSVL